MRYCYIAMHGLVCSGTTLDIAFGIMHTIEKGRRNTRKCHEDNRRKKDEDYYSEKLQAIEKILI